MLVLIKLIDGVPASPQPDGIGGDIKLLWFSKLKIITTLVGIKLIGKVQQPVWRISDDDVLFSNGSVKENSLLEVSLV